MTVIVLCGHCRPYEIITEIPDEVQSPGEKLFAAAVIHEVQCHLEEIDAS